MSDDRFYYLRARLKKGERLTLMERKEYARIGREMIQVWRSLPITDDVKRSIRAIESDIRMVRLERVRANHKTNWMEDLLK